MMPSVYQDEFRWNLHNLVYRLESIETYNNLRPHLSLQYKTPNEVHRASVIEYQNNVKPVY